MDWLTTGWSWLTDPVNRETLAFIGSGIFVLGGVLWKIYLHYNDNKPNGPEGIQQRPSPDGGTTASTTPIPKSGAVPQADPAALRMAYLRFMASEWRTLPLEVLEPSAADAAARRLTLERVYISLDTTTPRPEKLKHDPQAGEQEGPLSAVEALLHAERHRLVLLGQPGSGKSTFGRYLCLALADALLTPGTVNLAEQLPGWSGPAVLPVFLPLRQFAASLTSATGAGAVGQVQAFMRGRVDEREALYGFGEVLLKELQGQGGVVIFDGLDEVAGDQRVRVRQALSEFAELYPHCRVLVTCRVQSYRQDWAWQLPWEAHTLADFDPPKIRRFIGAWYDALRALNPGSPLDYGNKAQTLKSALVDPDDPRGLRDLAGIPLLLTVMVIVHTHKELPDSRVGVYRECVDILLMRWQAAREGDAQRIPLLNALLPYHVTTQKIHQGLKEIAYQAHQSGEQARQGSGGRALVSDFIIRGVMHKWLGAAGLDVFLNYCRHTNGLLLTERVVEQAGTTEALYVFPHLSFEEYLAALYLLQQPEGGITEAVDRAGDPAWWEVARFYGEYLCHDDQGANRHLAKALLEKLCPPRKPADDADWRRVWLAGALLPGWCKEVPEEDRDPELKQQVTNRLVDLLQTSKALQNDPPARATAGRVLANLDDPRRGVCVKEDGLPDLLWVRIPGTEPVRTSGRFPNFTGLRLGSGARQDSEARRDENWLPNAAPLEIADFELAVYPVTVAQFRPFVEQGYREERWWSDSGMRWRGDQTQPYFWEDPTWTLANHPVVGVSWYEAEAYCNWLNERLQLPSGTIRLPTEAEWEWAARGPEGRRYPWGGKDAWESWRCNSGESGINRTSAVGCFPGGAADWWRAIQPVSEMVHDLAGNVWEWTASEYTEDYAGAHRSILNANRSDDDLRVARGGSWNNEPYGLRSAARYGFGPRTRFYYRGFRLARTLTL